MSKIMEEEKKRSSNLMSKKSLETGGVSGSKIYSRNIECA
jgi:hypothetical protein